MTTLKCFLFFVVLLVQSAHAAEPTCDANPSESLKRTVIGIERRFDPDEVFVKNSKEVYGVQGTAWFLDESTLATIEHVVTGAKIAGEWKKIKLFWSSEKNEKAPFSFTVRVRVKQVLNIHPELESIITLELEEPFLRAVIPKVRARPLARSEAVVGIGYKDRVLRFAEGHLAFPEPNKSDEDGNFLPPYLPFEMVDPGKGAGDRYLEQGPGDRYVFDHGASGAPIFDCDGEVTAVASKFLTREMSILGKTMRVTTPWGQANILAVPATSVLSLQRKK